MYIIKYAWLNLKASFLKNLLTGIIVFVIAFAACISLSIREAADKTREAEMDELSVSANIRVDRNYVMQQMNSGEFDREEASDALSSLQGLTLDECLTYAEAEAVDGFYYTETVYLDSTDELEPIGDDGDPFSQNYTEGAGMNMPSMESQKIGDFTVIGYNSDEAMEDFQDGIKKIKDGEVFGENTEEFDCLISENLALYNSIEVGDIIKLVRPDDEEVSVELTVVGTYSNQTDAEYNTTREDPDNEILMSANALGLVVEELNRDIDAETDIDKIIESVVTGIFTFATADKFYEFEGQATALGLSEKYTIVSNDIATYEASLLPLENLKDYALILLAIILVVGVTVLVILNAITVNNRKKEIGTLAAMGMSRAKVAAQYIIEIFVVMIIFVSLGTFAGSKVAVPVTNQLLASQVEMQESQEAATQENFGRLPQGQTSTGTKPVGGDVEGEVDYIDEISYTTDYVVILQLIGIMVGLALISSMLSIIFILSIEPVKILSASD